MKGGEKILADHRVEKYIIDKECIHSRRYKATDSESVIQTVYVNRPFANGKDQIVIDIYEED